MASIRSYRTATGDRRYEVRFRDADRRDRSRAFSRHRDAQAFKIEVERRAQSGGFYVAPSARFDDVAREWLSRYENGAAGDVRPRPNTLTAVCESLARLEPVAALPVERIRRPIVEDMIAAIAGDAPRRAQMSLALLKRILRAAEERGHTVDASVYRVRVARPEEREPRFLTWEGADELASWLPEHVRRIVPIAILTLLRQGELLALRDQDVDVSAGAVRIGAQFSLGGRVKTKTRGSRRTVDVGPACLRLIREQQLVRSPNPDHLLFPTATGRPFERHVFMSRYFKPAARAAGVPQLTFHDLRHTGASLMIASGANVKAIAEQMGHVDGGALVLKRYGHLYSGARRQAALALEAHVFAPRPDPAVGQLWDGDPPT
jgi:integrase